MSCSTIPGFNFKISLRARNVTGPFEKWGPRAAQLVLARKAMRYGVNIALVRLTLWYLRIPRPRLAGLF